MLNVICAPRMCASLIAVALFGWSLAGVAQTPLSLAEAQRTAVERSRQLAAQDATIAASREMAAAAGQRPDPVLRLGVDNVPADGADRFSLARDFMTMRRIGVMQEVTRGEKLKLRAERFEHEAERGIAEKNATIAAVQKDTALAWIERHYLERMRAMVVAQAAEAQLEIETAESAYRAGRGSQTDIYAARAARVALDDRLSELDRRIRSARAMLARWVGAAADSPLEGEPPYRTLRLAAMAREQGVAQHPEIATLERQVAVAETEVRLAQANKNSDWSIEVAYQERGPAFSNMFSVGVSIPLQWDQKNRQDREIASKLALVERAKAQQEDALRVHVAEVQATLNEWENGHERIARYRSEMIPLAQSRTEAALAAYRGGKGELAAVLAARRNEIEVRKETLQLEMDTARIWAQFNFLVPDGAHERRPEPAAGDAQPVPAKELK